VSIQPTEVIRLDLPASHKHVNILGACISELLVRVEHVDDREAIMYNMQLAAHEACANIIDHAYAGDSGRRRSMPRRAAQRALRRRGASRAALPAGC